MAVQKSTVYNRKAQDLVMASVSTSSSCHCVVLLLLLLLLLLTAHSHPCISEFGVEPSLFDTHLMFVYWFYDFL